MGKEIVLFTKNFIVRKRTTGMLYAMKVINKKHIVSSDKVEQTICERKILSLLHHPFIVELHWAFTSVYSLTKLNNHVEKLLVPCVGFVSRW